MSGKKQIDRLFEKGKAKTKAPLKLMFLIEESEERDVKVMFVVPKKKFRKAHDRNKLRRRIRESYRLKKNEFYFEITQPVRVSLAFIYISSEASDHSTIQSAVHHLLNLLAKEIVPKAKRT